MRIAAFGLATVAAALVAGSALAATPTTDLDYLKANRCKGLATGSGGNAGTFDAYIKATGKTRTSYVLQKGEDEFDRARRESKTTNSERRERLARELAGPCAAYSG